MDLRHTRTRGWTGSVHLPVGRPRRPGLGSASSAATPRGSVFGIDTSNSGGLFARPCLAQLEEDIDSYLPSRLIVRVAADWAAQDLGSLLATLDVHPRVPMQILRHSKIAVTIGDLHRDTLARHPRRLKKLGRWDAVHSSDCEWAKVGQTRGSQVALNGSDDARPLTGNPWKHRVSSSSGTGQPGCGPSCPKINSGGSTAPSPPPPNSASSPGCSVTLSDGTWAPGSDGVGRFVGRVPAVSAFCVCILGLRSRYLCRQNVRSPVAVHS